MKFCKLFFVIFISLTSCREETEFERLLTDESKKWVYVDNPTFNKNSKLIAYIKFSKSNLCTNYYLKSNEKMNSGEWYYSPNDSSFSAFGRNFQFLKIVGDSIYVKYKEEDFTALFMDISNYKNIKSHY